MFFDFDGGFGLWLVDSTISKTTRVIQTSCDTSAWRKTLSAVVHMRWRRSMGGGAMLRCWYREGGA